MIATTYTNTMNAFSSMPGVNAVSDITMLSRWRCDAEEPRHGYGPADCCWRSGDRFRDGRWVCTRCYSTKAVRYFCG
jgi:hypothetical protein